ncbi:MAG: hypothetical protein ACRDTH_13045 [Pseudonocardiaceae bacterium]
MNYTASSHVATRDVLPPHGQVTWRGRIATRRNADARGRDLRPDPRTRSDAGCGCGTAEVDYDALFKELSGQPCPPVRTSYGALPPKGGTREDDPGTDDVLLYAAGLVTTSAPHIKVGSAYVTLS